MRSSAKPRGRIYRPPFPTARPRNPDDDRGLPKHLPLPGSATIGWLRVPYRFTPDPALQFRESAAFALRQGRGEDCGGGLADPASVAPGPRGMLRARSENVCRNPGPCALRPTAALQTGTARSLAVPITYARTERSASSGFAVEAGSSRRASRLPTEPEKIRFRQQWQRVRSGTGELRCDNRLHYFATLRRRVSVRDKHKRPVQKPTTQPGSMAQATVAPNPGLIYHESTPSPLGGFDGTHPLDRSGSRIG
jgi:hypothetical protein